MVSQQAEHMERTVSIEWGERHMAIAPTIARGNNAVHVYTPTVTVHYPDEPPTA